VSHRRMLRLRPELKGALLMLMGLVLLLFCVWIWIGIRIGIWTYPQYDRHVWLVETVPVAQALWDHRINAGDNAYALIHEWRPDQIDRFGRWIEMRWFPGGACDDCIPFIGVSVIAKDGFLLSAAAYSDDRLNNRIFFNTGTTNDEADLIAAREAYFGRLEAENALLATNFPVLQELWQGNIKSGNKAEDIIKKWQPNMITQFDHWTILRWFPANSTPATKQVFGVRMIAKNGIIVYANLFSDDGHHPALIDTETTQDKDDFDAECEQSVAAKPQHGTNDTR